MLFRRFLIVTALIALFAVIGLRLVEASHGPSEFAVGERMRAWQQAMAASDEPDGGRDR